MADDDTRAMRLGRYAAGVLAATNPAGRVVTVHDAGVLALVLSHLFRAAIAGAEADLPGYPADRSHGEQPREEGGG